MSQVSPESPSGAAPASAWPWTRVAPYAFFLLCVVGALIHQAGPTFDWRNGQLTGVSWRLWEWYVEDAAISFAYARNWAAGDGLVALPGGERIEGYSNPLWTALIAFFYLFGVSGFTSAKWIAASCSVGVLYIVWRIAEELIDEPGSNLPLFAPFFLAISSTFAFWNAAGLENPLFNLLLAAGIWRTIIEVRTGGLPWAALCFLGVTLCRPEGIMYAAWAGLITMMVQLQQRRTLAPTLKWLALFFVPFFAYHAVRYSYFAWAFPNTYYAKLGDRTPSTLNWNARGFKQVREWAHDTGLGWFVPLFLAGGVSLRGARRVLAVLLLSLLTAFLFLYPDTDITKTWSWWPTDLPTPDGWNDTRTKAIAGLGLLLPLLALRTPKAWARVLLIGFALITFFFHLRAGGDWMKGFRWMGFLIVPATLLLTLGVHELASLFDRTFGAGRRFGGLQAAGWVAVIAVGAALLPQHYSHSEFLFGKRETSPFDVQKRVDYMMSVADRLFIEGPIRAIDVDMGAHMYWAPFKMLDMAGLIDVPIARHSFKQREFTQHYIFDEHMPEFGHVHGGWAKSSRIPTFSDWRDNYVEIEGYPASRTKLHIGNHVRRDLIVLPTWDGPRDHAASFDQGFFLAGADLPAPEVSSGQPFFLRFGLMSAEVPEEDVRLLGFVSQPGGDVVTFDLPVGYDWMPSTEWRAGEVFHGRFAPKLPKLEPGAWDLGFLLLGEDGRVLPATTASAGGVIGGQDDEPAAVAAGEVRFPGLLRIGPKNTSEDAARVHLIALRKHADASECDAAEDAWRLAWQHLPGQNPWREKNEPLARKALSDCWVAVAEAEATPDRAVQPLERARHWNHRNHRLHVVARRVGESLHQQGVIFRNLGKWSEAYGAFAGAVAADPTRSWSRRAAEEARDHHLGIDADAVARAEAERRERLERKRRSIDARKANEN